MNGEVYLIDGACSHSKMGLCLAVEVQESVARLTVRLNVSGTDVLNTDVSNKVYGGGLI